MKWLKAWNRFYMFGLPALIIVIIHFDKNSNICGNRCVCCQMETMHVWKAGLTNLAFLGHFSCVASEITASVFSRSPVKSLLNTFITGPQLCFLSVETFVWQTNWDILDSHKRFKWIKNTNQTFTRNKQWQCNYLHDVKDIYIGQTIRNYASISYFYHMLRVQSQ